MNNFADINNSLFLEVKTLIENTKHIISVQTNSELTILFWKIGCKINNHILNNRRAEYGKQILVTVSQQLVLNFGRNFEEKNLRRMCQFANQFDDFENIVTLSRHLTWSHILTILPIKNFSAKQFYINKVSEELWSVRELRKQISRKAFERNEIANSQINSPSDLSYNTFKDPYLLDFLELKNGYLETDLEKAILFDLEQFILELGKGFTFVERQKRMIIDSDDYYLDLLFFHRKLHRLVAIELKIGKFKASFKGQMELYLKWLDKYEKQHGEEKPIGLILCAESSHEQIELLEMHKDGIIVAEYWTDLPPKKELEQKLRKSLTEARNRIDQNKLKLKDIE